MWEEKTVRVGLLCSGSVQGVGFRWFARQTASLLELTGLAENLPDGSVWVEVQGTPDRVEQFIGRIEAGHHWIEVTGLRQKKLPLREEYGFETL